MVLAFFWLNMLRVEELNHLDGEKNKLLVTNKELVNSNKLCVNHIKFLTKEMALLKKTVALIEKKQHRQPTNTSTLVKSRRMINSELWKEPAFSIKNPNPSPIVKPVISTTKQQTKPATP